MVVLLPVVALSFRSLVHQDTEKFENLSLPLSDLRELREYNQEFRAWSFLDLLNDGVQSTIPLGKGILHFILRLLHLSHELIELELPLFHYLFPLCNVLAHLCYLIFQLSNAHANFHAFSAEVTLADFDLAEEALKLGRLPQEGFIIIAANKQR